MRIIDDVGDRINAAGGDAGGFENRERLCNGMPAGPIGNGTIEFGIASDTPVVGCQLFIGSQIRSADRHHQPFENRITVSGNHDVTAIARRISVGWTDAGQRTAAARANMAHQIEFRNEALHQIEDALEQRDVYDLSLAAAGLDVQQRDQGADHGVQRGEAVADADTGARGRGFEIARRVAEAAHCFTDGAEAGAVAVGAGLPIAGDAHQRQTAIECGEHIPAEANLLQHAGPEILDNDIGPCRESLCNRKAFFGLQVERD